MTKKDFDNVVLEESEKIARLRELAHGVHDGVNQKYDKTHPYWFHLDMVADLVKAHGAEICARPQDVVPMLFGAYFHDSIEDARLTYNDVLALAKMFFDENEALIATEIAYALTNEKGRNRAERANEKYYSGIRTTPYAPLVKLADRVANYSYSMSGRDAANTAMKDVYSREMPHFIKSITAESSDKRLSLPSSLLQLLSADLKS